VVGTLTNNRGEFTLTMLEPGDYYLNINLQGYEGFRVKSIVIKKEGGKTDIGEIQLSKTSKKTSRQIARNMVIEKECNLAVNNY
jgi:hypothetical protein